jgi:hypothetical protein
MARAWLTVLLLSATHAWAAPRAFPFTWDSTTLAPGAKDVSLWLTPRLLRENERSFSRLELRAALGVGVAQSFETLLAIDVDMDATLVLGRAVDPKLSSLWHFSPFKATGLLGASVLGRVSLGIEGIEVEGRLILDKRFSGAWVALNSSITRGLFWAGPSRIDTRLEQSLGLGALLPVGVSVGAEVRARTAFQEGAYQGTAIHVGPAVTYTTPTFSVGMTVSTQVAADKAPADRALREPLELRDNERFIARIVVSVPVL